MASYTNRLYAMVAYLVTLGMSQRSIAEEADVSQATISRLYRKEPGAYDVPTLERIEAVFNKHSRPAA